MIQEIGWREEAAIPPWVGDGTARPETLRRVAQGDVVLAEAMLTLAHYHEEQTHTSTALLERETWVLTAILERSAPIWAHLPTPTLRFTLEHTASMHLELGLFSHLATLVAPRADELDLMAATTPCWAQVSTRRREHPAEEAGTLVRTYVPITVAEAVSALGLARIMTQIELATRTAGQTLLAQAQAQQAREALLWRAERMLGWESEPPGPRPAHEEELPTRLAFALLGPAGLPALALLGPIGLLALGGALWALMVALLCFLFGFPQALLMFLPGSAALLIWRWYRATRLTVDLRE